MISKVSAINFKGACFSHDLGKMTVFWGENGEGKSSRVEALELATTGQVHGATPKTSMKRPSDIVTHLASSTRMAVSAADTRLGAVSRDYSRDGEDCHCATKGKFSLPTVLFSASEFLDLSEKERVRALFNALPPPDLSQVGMNAIVAKVKSIVCDPYTEAHQAAVTKYCGLVESSRAASSETTQEWLEKLVEGMRDRANADAAEAKTMHQTVLGVTALKPDELPSLNPSESALKSARERLTAAHDKVTEARRQYAAAANELAAIPAAPAQDEHEAKMIADLRVEHDDLEARLKLYLEPAPLPVERVAEEVRGQERNVKALRGEVQSLLNEIKSFDRYTCCPTCQGKSKNWKKAVLSTLNSQVVLKQSELLNVEQVLGDLVSSKTRMEILAQQAALERSTHKAQSDRLEAVKRLLREHDDANAGLQSVSERRARIPQLQALMADLLSRGQALVVEENAAQSQVDAAEAAHQALVVQHSSNAFATAALERAEKADAVAQVGSLVRDMLAALLAKCVEQSVAPLVDLCNRLTSGILRSQVAYRDGGLVVSGRGGTTRSISGAEKALVYAGLSIALASRTGPRILILDEVNRLVGRNRTKLYQRIWELLEDGTLEQAILVVADTQPPQSVPPQATVIQVGGAQ